MVDLSSAGFLRRGKDGSGVIKFSLEEFEAERPWVPPDAEPTKRLEQMIGLGERISERRQPPTTVVLGVNLEELYEDYLRDNSGYAAHMALKSAGFGRDNPWESTDGPREDVTVISQGEDIRVVARGDSRGPRIIPDGAPELSEADLDKLCLRIEDEATLAVMIGSDEVRRELLES